MPIRSRILWMTALFLAACGGWLEGNSYEWIALKKLPLESEVVAFANRPMHHRSETLPRSGVMTFLTQGTLQTDSVYHVPFVRDRPLGRPLPDCRGVFITRDGVTFFWSLVHEQVMKLMTSEGRSCFISLPTPGVAVKADPHRTDGDVYQKMNPPDPDEIRWFFNDEGPATGGSVQVPKGKVMQLLEAGRRVKCVSITDEFNLQEEAWFTLPPALAADARTSTHFPMRGDALQIGPMHMQIQVQGIMATKKGRVFYWEQWGDHLLALRDDAGGICVLKTAAPN